MYEVYFCWWRSEESEKQRVLWYPLNLPDLTEEEAKRIAVALLSAMPEKRWAFGPKWFGPKWLNGVTEVS